jgi:predicted helicase
LTAQDIKRAACERVFGFELLPAPFVVAHLQLGLLLQKLGAPLSDDKSERAGVYLTNALTGWQPPEKAKQTIMFAELEQERDAAEHVKREAPILVILGNPPYNGFAGLAVGEEQDLTSAYRKASGTQQPQGQGLNDLYVRFYRMAERRIAEQTGEGIVCYISNYSWLDGLSFTAMRERYLAAFDSVWVDNLNGDKYKTGKRTPTGESDPSIFSTEWNHEGIQVGTAIALLVRKHEHVATSAVQFRQLWGKDKRACLLADSANHAPPHYQTLMPADALGLPFLPVHTQAGYGDWPRLPELFPVSFPGVKTSRDDVVVDIDRVRLIRRMTDYFDQSISHERMRAIAPGAMESTGRFRAEYVRDQLRKRGFLADKIVPYYYRPFDVRWLYWEPETDLLDRKRDDYFPHIFDGNTWIEARQKQPMERFDRGFPVVTLADNLGNGLSSYFPLFLRGQQRASLFETGSDAEVTPNLSAAASDYLSGLHADPSSLFYHVLTMLHAPAYRSENAGALRQDWPRVPLPDDAATLEAGATLGRQLFALFDAQMPVLGVTGAPLRTELRAVGGISRVDGKPLDAEHDLDLTAGWGFAGQGGVTMAGKGRAVARPYKAAEMESLRLGAGALGLSPEEVLVLLGPETYDIWLNEVAYWCNVPTRVWEYTIGGYQVLKKWLSYRERRLLGRGLRQEEAREVGGIARRIAAILLLGPALDAQYRAAIAAPQAWPGQAGRSAT